MLRRKTPWLLLMLGGALALTGCGQEQPSEKDTQERVAVSAELSAAEIRKARDVAEALLAETPGKTVFIKVELLPGPTADAPQRQVRVTHYRYERDETVYTCIDLKSGAVLLIEKLDHVPTALADEEKERAERLVRGEPRLADTFAAFAQLRVELRPHHVSRDDELFGHRLVLADFATGDSYIGPRAVVVDLSTGQVHFGKTPLSTQP
jgi:hypothetical protein